MHADLDRLIRLQQIDSFTDTARKRIADHPTLVQALDGRLAAANEALERARARQAADQAARRSVEKDLAMVQSRLSKYKDQLMEVKTNKEYQAVLKEIEVAQGDVRRLEDRILEHMLASDDLIAQVKAAETRLAADKTEIAAERQALGVETARLERELAEAVGARHAIVVELPPALLGTYDLVARGRKGLAVVEAKGGFCSACHVRIRPQVFNDLLRNDTIFQCASCQRILYYVPPTMPSGDADGGAAR